MKYAENKEVAMQMEEDYRRMAKKYPWWKLLYWRMFNLKQWEIGLRARWYGEGK